jgi:hypothetical protein
MVMDVASFLFWGFCCDHTFTFWVVVVVVGIFRKDPVLNEECVKARQAHYLDFPQSITRRRRFTLQLRAP